MSGKYYPVVVIATTFSKTMYQDTLQQLGLAKNEAHIYEVLLLQGHSPVSDIAKKAKVHRRNTYDSLNRLIERGLVFEVLESREHYYQAVAPVKLTELLEEKQRDLSSIMPKLESMYNSTPREDEVYIYRGIQGFKNYMRDILRTGQDTYTIGGKGQWADPRIQSFLTQFMKEANKKGITFRVLFDQEVKQAKHKILDHFNKNTRFLPVQCSTTATLDIFGDRVVIVKGITLGKINEHSSYTVIVNQDVANAFRTWFKLLWQVAEQFD
jgi:sugar-specific transcriptional regulator TrmB